MKQIEEKKKTNKIKIEVGKKEETMEVTEVIEQLTEEETIAVNNAMQIVEDDGMKELKLKSLN